MEFRKQCAAALLPSTDVEHFKELALNCIKPLGFSDFDYSVIERPYHNYTRIISTLPEPLLKSYSQCEIYKHDVLTDYLHDNITPIFWSSVTTDLDNHKYRYETHRQHHNLIKLMKHYSYFDTLSVPIGQSGSKHILSFCSKESSKQGFKELVEKNLYNLKTFSSVVVNIANLKFPKLYQPPLPEILLTEMQVKVLIAFAKYDKSSHKVAQRLGISHKTVEKHMDGAKKALGAFSNINAVYRALEKGLIPL